VAAFIVLGAIYADLAGNHCDLPRAMGSKILVAAATHQGSVGDPCSSGCVPDCYSCSRSEAAVLATVASVPQVIAEAIVGPLAAASDGVRPLPYHPPLHLL
jgi:hypothetical protein